ncbi:MAG TPA: DNA polymerase/3'-5' exonuclease PolX [Terriglobales bacterium]|nr:DNA polymerase/3'-5' exonuclease PolX [Terriglobales bacterium]
MDNRTLANVLYETADLLEVANEDPFRIRSYRRAAEALEAHSQQVAPFICENNDKAVLAIPGIGKGMLANLKELCSTGKLQLHADLLTKYQPAMLDLLKISGLGPKTIALIWDTYHVCDPAGVQKLAEEGKIRTLPRMGEKAEQKILKGIASFLSTTGRYHLDEADTIAQKMIAHLTGFPGVDKITPAGSFRRGRDTVGDLDILVTGKGCEENSPKLEAIKDKVLAFPGILEVLVRGDNKVSFKLRSGMQVDVRLLPPASFGAAMQYFTGSKNHNVTLRQRALKMGFTLNEYGLFVLEDGKDEKGKNVAGKFVAGKTEEEVYKKLGLPYIPPEMRENCGEIDAAAEGKLPDLITQDDIQGDVHMHTIATDGKNTIEEMARAAKERGYKYMAITDHSKNLAFANGLDDARALEHIRKIRAVSVPGIKIFAGIEVDILTDGELDLSDSVLAEMDLVIASIHSHFQQEPAKITDRLLRVLDNKYVSIVGHPTGRMLLRREGYKFDMDKILDRAAKNKVAMEHNAYPDRLDLNDVHLRMARERGVKIVINTDAHHTTHMEKIKYGILQARRAWLTKKDVLNTLPVAAFAKAMKRA